MWQHLQRSPMSGGTTSWPTWLLAEFRSLMERRRRRTKTGVCSGKSMNKNVIRDACTTADIFDCPRWCLRHALDDVLKWSPSGPLLVPKWSPCGPQVVYLWPLGIIFDILEVHAFWKYSISCVFSALYLAIPSCTWLCLGLPWSTSP